MRILFRIIGTILILAGIGAGVILFNDAVSGDFGQLIASSMAFGLVVGLGVFILLVAFIEKE